MASTGEFVLAAGNPADDPETGNVATPDDVARINLFARFWNALLNVIAAVFDAIATQEDIIWTLVFNIYTASALFFLQLWRSVVVVVTTLGNLCWNFWNFVLGIYNAATVFVVRECGEIYAFFAWLVILVSTAILNAYGVLSAQFFELNNWVRARVYGDDKKKLLFTYREVASFAPTVIAAIFTVTALRFPQETIKQRRILGTFLAGLTAFYFAAYYVSVVIDVTDDNASFLYYTATTPGGRKVFYYKIFQHFVGFLVVGLTATVSYTTCFSAPSWGTYYLTVTAGLLAVVYAMLQAYRTDTSPCLVEESDEGLVVGIRA